MFFSLTVSGNLHRRRPINYWQGNLLSFPSLLPVPLSPSPPLLSFSPFSANLPMMTTSQYLFLYFLCLFIIFLSFCYFQMLSKTRWLAFRTPIPFLFTITDYNHLNITILPSSYRIWQTMVQSMACLGIHELSSLTRTETEWDWFTTGWSEY